MSIPDTIDYILDNMNIATWHSEYEKEFPFYSQSSYVWMDCFKSEWISWGNLEEHLKSGKKYVLSHQNCTDVHIKKFGTSMQVSIMLT